MGTMDLLIGQVESKFGINNAAAQERNPKPAALARAADASGH